MQAPGQLNVPALIPNSIELIQCTNIVELNRFAVGAATKICMDNEQPLGQCGVGLRLSLVPIRPTGSRCNLLSQRHMDTLHCSLDVGGSAAQFNSSVSAMPPLPSRTFEWPVHSDRADTLLLR
jgi:hypothetical protein